MLRNKRNGGVQNFEDASDLDVVISREIDTSVSRELKNSLGLVEKTTRGVVNPMKVGHISLRILGSESLKNSLGIRKGRNYYIDHEKLQDIEDEINKDNAVELMALEVQDKHEPFCVDSENDQLIAMFSDSNESYANDRLYIKRKVMDYLKVDTLSNSEIDELAEPAQPDLAVANISRNMVTSDQLQGLLEDPNYFIREAIHSNLDKAYKINSKEPIPELIIFGGFKVALRQRRPNHFGIKDQADSLGKHRFDKNGRLVRVQELEYV